MHVYKWPKLAVKYPICEYCLRNQGISLSVHNNLNFLLVQNSGDTPPGSNKPDRLISSHGHLDQEMTTTTSLISASGQQQVATGNGKMGGPGLATNSILFSLGFVKIRIIVLPVGQIMYIKFLVASIAIEGMGRPREFRGFRKKTFGKYYT